MSKKNLLEVGKCVTMVNVPTEYVYGKPDSEKKQILRLVKEELEFNVKRHMEEHISDDCLSCERRQTVISEDYTPLSDGRRYALTTRCELVTCYKRRPLYEKIGFDMESVALRPYTEDDLEVVLSEAVIKDEELRLW